MKYYTFDSAIGEFLHSGTAAVDPLETLAQGKRVYLLPAASTWISPGEKREGFAQVWNGETWEYMPDHRGKTVWKSSGESMTVTELGDVPAGYALTPPAKELTAADYDMAMEKFLYDTRAARGYTTREPDFYLNSTVARWSQDAADWVKFRDEVMLYALEVQNTFIVTGNAPSLTEFIAAMPEIKWSYGA